MRLHLEDLTISFLRSVAKSEEINHQRVLYHANYYVIHKSSWKLGFKLLIILRKKYVF